MIGTTLAIASLIASAAGAAGSAIQNNRNTRELAKRRNELDMEYKHDYNMDFLNTPMAKSAISLLSQRYIENARKYAQGAIITGKSEEQQVAAAGEMQKPLVNTISQLAGYGQQRQESLRNRYLYSREHLADLQFANDQQKSQNWSNLGTNAMNAGIGFAEADASGSFANQDDWIKNLFSNNGGLAGTKRGKIKQLQGLEAGLK